MKEDRTGSGESHQEFENAAGDVCVVAEKELKYVASYVQVVS